MKRTEMIEHIAEELLNIVNAHAHSWQDEEKFCSRKASDLLDMIEGFGMRPPEREDLVEIKPDDENVYKTSYGSPAIDLDYGPIYRKVKISGWESEE